MKRPKLEYAENCTLIHTYSRKLEEYCDELEKALDKAIKKITLDNDEGFEHLDSQYEYWKDWLTKDE